MKKSYFSAMFFLVIVLFQNFKTYDIAFDPKYYVKEQTRLQHAKEVLGKKYSRSIAAQVEGQTILGVEVLNIVSRNLPKKNQSKADKIAKAIIEESNKYDIDPIFVASVIKTESSFNHLAVGTSGEIGLMQLMPNTGEYIAKRIKLKFNGAKTLRDPVKNIKIGVAYIHYLRTKFGNDAKKYIPAYNMGPGKFKKAFASGERPVIYGNKILKFYEQFYKKIYVSQMFMKPNLAVN